jgi:hypothetical protein
VVQLTTCQVQLSLFPWRPLWEPARLGRDKQDRRTPDQWIRSVLAYLDWRSGDSWRPLSVRTERENSERWAYLEARRIVQSVRYASEPSPVGLHVALPVLNPARRVAPLEAKWAAKPRAEIVAALMAASPALTDHKILSHLPRPKLAKMLCDALAAKPARLERTA